MQIIQILKNRRKILGQNSRNLNYINTKGSKRGRRIADNKLRTKELLIKEGIAVPKLIGTIKNFKEFQNFNWDSLPKSFVIKPVHGSQGGGIEIFYNRDTDGNWIKSDGSRTSLQELQLLAQDIIDGKFSIKNEPDQVFFEERVRTHPDLKNFSYKGTPDIRVVIYNNIPIMAYTRFPTKESGGKANMILGAVGTGIDLATGTTTTSTYGKGNGGKGVPIDFVPGTKLRYNGLTIPFWNEILRYSSKTLATVGLKYGAVDFLIDADNGPVVVEISARPGLSIQLVNRVGLEYRLQRVKGLNVKNIEQGIRLGKELFGGEIEEEIERISGKEVISNLMPVKIYGEGDEKLSTLALIDTSRRTTVLDFKSAKKLGYIFNEMPEGTFQMRNIKFKLGSHIVKSECRIIPKPLKGNKILIGRKDLSNYIIDIKRIDQNNEEILKKNIYASNPKTSFEELDNVFKKLSKTLSVIPSLKPINLKSEKEKFFDSKFDYNPQFKYKSMKFDSDDMIVKLNSLNPPEDEIGKLYRNKIQEFKTQIFLIESIGRDPELFTKRSIDLFGCPKNIYLKYANTLLEKYPNKPEDLSRKLTKDEVIKRIQLSLDKFEINSEITIKKEKAPTKASVGKSSGKIFLNKNFNWTENTLNGMIAHEIETHLLKFKRGSAHEYDIFALGTASYMSTEEGLATIMKYSQLDNQLMFIPAIRYLSIDKALNEDFRSVFKFLNQFVNPEQSFNFSVRVKRGIADTSTIGSFTKDQYFGWALSIAKTLIEKPHLIQTAFNGKANLYELNKFTEPKDSKNITKARIQKLLVANIF